MLPFKSKSVLSISRKLPVEEMFYFMQRHKVSIYSYGRGLGVNFVDGSGRPHTIEYDQVTDLQRVISGIYEEVQYHDSDVCR